jgi:putative tricarboxylic transport membrane protein
MGIILGPLLETHFRRALIISQGSYATFFSHPISAVFLSAAAVSLLYPLIRWAIQKRKK